MRAWAKRTTRGMRGPYRPAATRGLPSAEASDAYASPPVGARLLLVRHGQSEWNEAGRWQGWADIDLTDMGRDQARHAAATVAAIRPDAVVSSGMRRATETAQLLVDGLGLPEVEVEAGFKEYDVGEWSGCTRDEIAERWPGMLEPFGRGELGATPGGESRVAFLARLEAAVHRTAILHAGQTVLVVSHGGAIGSLTRRLDLDKDRGVRIANLMGRWFIVDDVGAISVGPVVHLLEQTEETASPDL